MPQVELISNITHYYYTGLSLLRSGLLGNYITGPSALATEQWLSHLGGPFARAYRERRLAGLPPDKVKRMWLPEILQKAVGKFGGTGEQANWTHNELFARRAAELMGECDAVHFVQSVGRESARRAKREGAKVVCDMRSEHPQFQKDILLEEGRKLGVNVVIPGSTYEHRVLEELYLADAIFTPSHYAKRTFVQEGFSADRVVVCPYGVDTSAFLPRPMPRVEETFTVLFLGNICMRKGIHYLLEAFAKAALRNAKLILAGPIDPSFRSILHKFDGLFEAPGPIPRSELHRYYRQSDVFVIPSLADAYPLVTMEAMASGLPVIVSENTGTSELVRNRQNGFVVPIRSAEAIAEKLCWLYENRRECASMGAAAMITAKKQNWENYGKACQKFYKNFLGGRETPGASQEDGISAATLAR
jgi:glycosyltransferase involved in cell wall biosynthesis